MYMCHVEMTDAVLGWSWGIEDDKEETGRSSWLARKERKAEEDHVSMKCINKTQWKRFKKK